MAFWNRDSSKQNQRDNKPAPPAPKPAATPAPAAAPAAAPTPNGAGSPAQDATKNPADPTFLRSSLSADTSVTGKLSFAAPTRIDGKLKGEVRADDLLLVGEKGSVEGKVFAKALILQGSVRGDVIGTEWVQVEATALLVGSVQSHRIDIQKGAKVQAHLSIAPAKGSTSGAGS